MLPFVRTQQCNIHLTLIGHISFNIWHDNLLPVHFLSSMGVYGLTTYLREKKRLLATSIELTASSSSKNPTSIVVDGWS